MTIDHGLGGKDSKKSIEKRQNRADRQKKFARQALTGGKKKAVVFDESARVDYLTGFHERKQARRKHGLALQIIKDKKKVRTDRAIKRQSNAPNDSSRCSAIQVEENEAGEMVHGEGEAANSGRTPNATMQTKADRVNAIFDDEHTTSMFGGSVSIVIDEIQLTL